MDAAQERIAVIQLRLDSEPRVVACLGAHPDDIEIGAGGTLAKLAGRYPNTRFEFVVFTGDEARQAEATDSAHAMFGNRATITFGAFEDGYLPYREVNLVKDFLFDSVKPSTIDLVLAPNRADMHQDHRFVSDLAGQAFQDHLVFGYEIIKYAGDLGQPQAYVTLTAEEATAKLDHLVHHFPSQHGKPWYRRDGFSALMGVRGIEAASDSGYAEAFYVTKAVVG